MNVHKKMTADTIIRYLYFLTPVYMILDYFFNFNIRISFLSNFPAYKLAYYLLCLFFSLIIYKFPLSKYYIAFTENMFNLAINIVGFLYPYLVYTDVLVEQSNDNVKFYDLQSIINFIVSGTVFIISINFLQMKITKDLRGNT